MLLFGRFYMKYIWAMLSWLLIRWWGSFFFKHCRATKRWSELVKSKIVKNKSGILPGISNQFRQENGHPETEIFPDGVRPDPQWCFSSVRRQELHSREYLRGKCVGGGIQVSSSQACSCSQNFLLGWLEIKKIMQKLKQNNAVFLPMYYRPWVKWKYRCVEGHASW